MEEKTTPLRKRMIEDMNIRGMGDKAQKAHIRAIKDFTRFLGRSPDTATPDDLRAYQLHMTEAGVTPPTFNARIMALRFLFGTTCKKEEMHKHMQFRRQPRRLPVVLSMGTCPRSWRRRRDRASSTARRSVSPTGPDCGPRRSVCSRSATSTAPGC